MRYRLTNHQVYDLVAINYSAIDLESYSIPSLILAQRFYIRQFPNQNRDTLPDIQNYLGKSRTLDMESFFLLEFRFFWPIFHH